GGERVGADQRVAVGRLELVGPGDALRPLHEPAGAEYPPHPRQEVGPVGDEHGLAHAVADGGGGVLDV
ncbi:hypothetical protein D6V09_18955, partial [Vibrio cholerae]|nr:hypothetical protein [Vibrio cholerae]